MEFSSEKNGLNEEQDGSWLNVLLGSPGHVIDLDEVADDVAGIGAVEDTVVS